MAKRWHIAHSKRAAVRIQQQLRKEGKKARIRKVVLHDMTRKGWKKGRKVYEVG